MRRKTPQSKIIWAFNPFQEDRKGLKNCVKLLAALSRQSGLPVEPVYVVSPAELNVALEFSVPEQERFHAVALMESEKVLKKLRFPGLLPATILVENQLRTSASTKRLARYAKLSRAFVLVVGTQGKKGIGRLILGSFAETLLLHAQTPMFLVNPHFKIRGPIKRFLFATDFSKGSRQVFRRFCTFLRPLKGQVLLFHMVQKPVLWGAATQLVISGVMPETRYLELLQQKREQDARAFLRIAKTCRVPVTLLITSGGEDVSEAICRQAKKEKIDAIGMAAQSVRWDAALLGSTSRDVLREAPFPVWILRPQ